jgi:hypothetical protein
MSGISSTRIANWINVNYGNKFDPFRVTIKPPLLGVVIDFFHEDYKREGIMSSEDWPSQDSGWIEKNIF